MASLLLRPLMRPQTLGLGLGLSVASYHAFHQRPIRLDSSPFPSDSYKRDTQTPVLSRAGSLNPRAVRQISSGSIIGLLVSTFSKSLALILGLLVVGVQGMGWKPNTKQWASSYGVNVIPYNRLQRYFTSLDLRSAVQDNVAFKLSFGTTFAMASFLEF
ncbi:hypothetical protein LSUB1_G002242 [Lachnellula subtilissima]|uniref:Uncharacterized protein n=1 Tax=Lachnellula subtilissima TaxID=602034 RepID=A0A8H8RP81_9HELO|nr:hypothetical protein LSUB1_G002242 [Lachnellula subtilissima]